MYRLGREEGSRGFFVGASAPSLPRSLSLSLSVARFWIFLNYFLSRERNEAMTFEMNHL
jgi:hypothetical protein